MLKNSFMPRLRWPHFQVLKGLSENEVIGLLPVHRACPPCLPTVPANCDPWVSPVWAPAMSGLLGPSTRSSLAPTQRCCHLSPCGPWQSACRIFGLVSMADLLSTCHGPCLYLHHVFLEPCLGIMQLCIVSISSLKLAVHLLEPCSPLLPGLVLIE